MKTVSAILIPILCLSFLSSSAHAQLIPLHNLNLSQKQDSSLGQRMVSQLDHPVVVQKMQELGVDRNEAKERILALSDSEIRDIIEHPEQTGGDVIVVSLTTVLLIVIIYLLIN